MFWGIIIYVTSFDTHTSPKVYNAQCSIKNVPKLDMGNSSDIPIVVKTLNGSYLRIMSRHYLFSEYYSPDKEWFDCNCVNQGLRCHINHIDEKSEDPDCEPKK
jgi:hypothetical protein